MSTQTDALRRKFFLQCPRKRSSFLRRTGNRTITAMTVATEFHRTSPAFCVTAIRTEFSIFFIILLYIIIVKQNSSIYYKKIPATNHRGFFPILSIKFFLQIYDNAFFSRFFSRIANQVAVDRIGDNRRRNGRLQTVEIEH